MATYAELKKQIESLTKQAEELRKAEIAKVIADIREKIASFGISAADLGFSKSTKRKTADIKYRNKETGETWSGRGREPKWIAGKDRKMFEV